MAATPLRLHPAVTEGRENGRTAGGVRAGGGGEAARGCKRHEFLNFSSFGSTTCLQRAVADL